MDGAVDDGPSLLHLVFLSCILFLHPSRYHFSHLNTLISAITHLMNPLSIVHFIALTARMTSTYRRTRSCSRNVACSRPLYRISHFFLLHRARSSIDSHLLALIPNDYLPFSCTSHHSTLGTCTRIAYETLHLCQAHHSCLSFNNT